MADFESAFEQMIQNEGGYQLHEVHGDRGGMTYAGIARRFHPEWLRKQKMGGVMAGLLELDFGGIIKGVGGIIDDLHTSDEKKLKASLQEKAMYVELANGQVETNQVEAKHRSVMVAQVDALWRKYDDAFVPAGIVPKIRDHQAQCPRVQIARLWWALGILTTVWGATLATFIGGGK